MGDRKFFEKGSDAEAGAGEVLGAKVGDRMWVWMGEEVERMTVTGFGVLYGTTSYVFDEKPCMCPLVHPHWASRNRKELVGRVVEGLRMGIRGLEEKCRRLPEMRKRLAKYEKELGREGLG